MKIKFFLLVFFSISFSLHSQSEIILPKYFYKKFEGTIGNNLFIKMEMIRKDSLLIGNYSYDKNAKQIYFNMESRIENDNKIHIEEDGGFDSKYNNIVTGIFEGEFVSENEISGVWRNPKRNKTLSFDLVEKYSQTSTKLKMNYHSMEYGDCEGEPCAKIYYFYPTLIDFHNYDVQNKTNKNILTQIISSQVEEVQASGSENWKVLMNNFIEEYKSFEEEAESEFRMRWESSLTPTIRYNENNILSIEMMSYSFLGGAHGNYFISHYVYDLRTGELVALDDVLNKGYKSVITKIAEAEFRKVFEIPKNHSLNDSGFWFENEVFILNNNFSINQEGIVFQFNPYEIGPYAIGAPAFTIPYAQISSFIKPDGLLGRFIKK